MEIDQRRRYNRLMLYPPQLVLWEVILAKVIQSGPEAPVSHETCTLVPRFGKEGRHKGE